MRHNKIRNIMAKLLTEVCYGVEIEPSLQPLSGETFMYRSAIINAEVRLDIKAHGVWNISQDAFFNVQVFHPNAPSYRSKDISILYKQYRAVGTGAAGTAFAAPVFLINDGRKFQYYGDSFRLRLMGPHVHPVTAMQTNSLVISMSSATAEATRRYMGQSTLYSIVAALCHASSTTYSYNVQYFLV